MYIISYIYFTEFALNSLIYFDTHHQLHVTQCLSMAEIKEILLIIKGLPQHGYNFYTFLAVYCGSLIF